MLSARQQLSAQSSSGSQRASGYGSDVPAPDALLTLQQTVGNQGLLRLLNAGSGLSKPRRGSAQVAETRSQVAIQRRAHLGVQRKCAACAAGAACSSCLDEEEELQRKPRASGGLMIQRAANGGATSRSSEGQSSAASAPRLIVEDNAQQDSDA